MRGKEIFVLVTLLLLAAVSADKAYGEDKVVVSPLRGNGLLWLSYGPGIINSCKAVVYRENGSNEMRVSEGEPRFAAIKEWLSTNIERRLNLSPTKPCVTEVEVSRSITLYSDPDTSSSHLLLHIPLTSQILAPKSKNVASRTEERLGQLQALFKGKVASTADEQD
ncbi:MAG: hypothetical protein JST01_20450 [Cyanobacteria bacterium SZAS TMP-1]|nr:hypothetical protein [Cyanobacteria bacterium SZAS TMP-1]